ETIYKNTKRIICHLMGIKVIVVGGGNAALSGAIEASERGNDVTLFEASTHALRGGNSKYTRDIRYAHDEDEFTSGSYPKDELRKDLLSVSGSFENPEVAELVIDRSQEMAIWMQKHGITFKKEIRGTLNLSRTNAFFMGGGKVLIDTYYELIKKLKVKVIYEAPIISISITNGVVKGVTALIKNEKRQFTADKYIFASGGFESNKEWLSQFWGESVKNIKIRGCKFNTGIPLRSLIENNALMCGAEKAGHMVAVDSRSPEYDAGITSRIDAIPFGIVVNKNGERFYDEGEDIWPKRYAIWGRLIAEQESQVAYAIVDNKALGKFMPTAYPSIDANSVFDLAVKIHLEPQKLIHLVSAFNKGITKNGEDVFNWSYHGSGVPKSHWAMPIDTPPFHAYPLSPGLTFTYQGVRINKTGRIILKDGELENGFAAGEIASGNVLRSGYLAGFGLTIGTTLGRLAGGWEND
ncbi:MAG: FAD-dependent tricarballylate dehydrogenase TcuA, partial [Nitrososphaerota archaeon]